MKRRRSILFVPASSDKYISKAASLSNLDAVILDLEDALSIEEKEPARLKLPETVGKLRGQGKEIFIRINDFSTMCGINDILCAAALRPDAIVLPKATERSITAADEIMSAIEAGHSMDPDHVRLLLMIETAYAAQHMDALMRVSARIDGLIFGAEDYTNDLELEKETASVSILHAKAALVNAAKAYNVDAIDTPCTDYKNPQVYGAEIRQARQLGFTGKTCIHPAMIGEINRAFVPTQKQVEQAQRILSCYEKGLKSRRGAVSCDGMMIDRPVAERAKRVLIKAGVSPDFSQTKE